MMKTTLTLILATFLCADGMAQERGRERVREARQEKKQDKKQDKADWNKKYEAYLKKNPAIAKKVKSGDITKAQVLAGMKARSAEKEPTEEEQLEALYQQMLKDRPGIADIPKERLMPRLKAMLEAQNKKKRGGDERRGRGEGEGNELADRQKKFRVKIGEMVRAGKITRAEAGELWKLAFGDEGRGGGRRGEGEERRRRDGDKGKGDERRRRRDR